MTFIKKIIFILLLFHFVPNYIFSQKKIDSLKKVLKNTQKTSVKLELYNTISSLLVYQDVNQAETFAQKALDISQKIGNKKETAFAYQNLSIVYNKYALFRDAINYGNQAKKLFELQKDSINIVISLNNLGTFYRNLGNFNRALKYYFKGLKTINKYQKNSVRQADLLQNIALVYGDQKNFSKALYYLKKSIKIEEKANMSSNLSVSYFNLADLYYSISKYSQAGIYVKKAKKLAKKYKQKNIEAKALMLETYNLQAQNNLKKVEHNLIEAENILANSGFELEKIHLNWHWANFEQARKNYIQSNEYAKKALKKAKKQNAKREVFDAYTLLIQNYEKLGKYEEALQYLKQQNKYNKQLWDIEKYGQILKIQSEYEIEKVADENRIKTLEINQLEQKHSYQRLIIILTIFTLIVTVILFIILINRQKIKIKKQKLENKLASKKQLLMQEKIKSKEHFIEDLRSNINQRDIVLNKLEVEINTLKEQNLKTFQDDLHNLKDWNDIQILFEQLYPNFIKKLNQDFSALSANELKVCMLLKLNLSSKEIANILKLNPKSIDTYRSKIRKKLSITKKQNLNKFINNI